MSSSFRVSVVWAYVQALTVRFLTGFGFLAMGWYIGPSEFGTFAVIAIALMLAEILCEQIWSQAAVQLKDLTRSHFWALFRLSFGLALLLSITIYYAGTPLSVVIDTPAIAGLMHWAAICPILMAVCAVPGGILRRTMNYKALAFRSFLAGLLSTSVGIALAYLGFGAWALLWQAIIYWLINAMVLWTYGRQEVFVAGENVDIGAMAKLGAANALLKAADLLETKGAEALVVGYFGVAALGLYSFAMKIVQTIQQMFLAPILDVLLSDMSRSSDVDEKIGSIRKTFSLLSIFSVLPFLLIVGFGADAISLVYRGRWDGAALLLAALSAATLPRLALYPIGVALQSFGVNRKGMVLSLLRAVVFLALLWLVVSLSLDLRWVAAVYCIAALVVFRPLVAELARKLASNSKQVGGFATKMLLASMVTAVFLLTSNEVLNDRDAIRWGAALASLLAYMGLMFSAPTIRSLKNARKRGGA